MARPRTGAGTAAHSFCAARAASQAATKVAASARRTSATTSSVFAGFVEVAVPAGASVAGRPLTIEAMVRVAAAVVDMQATVSARGAAVTSPPPDPALILRGPGVFGAPPAPPRPPGGGPGGALPPAPPGA